MQAGFVQLEEETDPIKQLLGRIEIRQIELDARVRRLQGWTFLLFFVMFVLWAVGPDFSCQIKREPTGDVKRHSDV